MFSIYFVEVSTVQRTGGNCMNIQFQNWFQVAKLNVAHCQFHKKNKQKYSFNIWKQYINTFKVRGSISEYGKTPTLSKAF